VLNQKSPTGAGHLLGAANNSLGISENYGGRSRARTADLLLVREPCRFQRLYRFSPNPNIYSKLGNLLSLRQQPRWVQQIEFGHSFGTLNCRRDVLSYLVAGRKTRSSMTFMAPLKAISKHKPRETFLIEPVGQSELQYSASHRKLGTRRGRVP
jgi:hypothetical protein